VELSGYVVLELGVFTGRLHRVRIRELLARLQPEFEGTITQG
jgi:predicted nucleotide-binding protein